MNRMDHENKMSCESFRSRYPVKDKWFLFLQREGPISFANA